MKKHFLIVAVVIFSATAIQSCENNKKQNENTDKTEIVDHSKMDHSKIEGNQMDIKMTGDFDVDFANTMMMHHQSAIDMSKKVLETTSNVEVNKIATNIIKAQETEITSFKKILKNYKSPEIKNDKSSLLAKNMEQMEVEMKAIFRTSDADKYFLAMMIPHHKSAVLMGEDELKYGTNLPLKEMAKKIVADQTAEIKILEDLLLKIK